MQTGTNKPINKHINGSDVNDFPFSSPEFVFWRLFSNSPQVSLKQTRWYYSHLPLNHLDFFLYSTLNKNTTVFAACACIGNKNKSWSLQESDHLFGYYHLDTNSMFERRKPSTLCCYCCSSAIYAGRSLCTPDVERNSRSLVKHPAILGLSSLVSQPWQPQICSACKQRCLNAGLEAKP